MLGLPWFVFICGSVLMILKSCYKTKTVVKLQILVRVASNVPSLKKMISDLQAYPLVVDGVICHSKPVFSVQITFLVYVPFYASAKIETSSDT